MPNTQSKFVEVYRASHPLQAHAITLALEDAGIPSFIENEALQDALGDLPGGWATSPRILVEDSQVEAARMIIDQSDHGRQSDSQLTAQESVTALTAGMLGWMGVALVPGDGSPQTEAPETTRCLACNAIMDEADSKCSSCGWSYATSAESETNQAEIEEWS